MTKPGRRGRAVIGTQLESLEGRTLLSGAAVSLPHPPAIVAAVITPKVVTISGQVAGTASEYYNPKFPLYNTILSARGTAAGIAGSVLLGGYQTSTLKGLTGTVTNGKASFAFTSAANTTLSVSYKGSGQANPKTYIQTLTFTGTISGGTGVFAGVTGTFTATATANARTNAFVLSYTFKITPAH